MRRVCSILFVLLFGLGPLAVAIDGGDASSACLLSPPRRSPLRHALRSKPCQFANTRSGSTLALPHIPPGQREPFANCDSRPVCIFLDSSRATNHSFPGIIHLPGSSASRHANPPRPARLSSRLATQSYFPRHLASP